MPSDDVDKPSLKVIKVKLDRTSSNLKILPAHDRDVRLDDVGRSFPDQTTLKFYEHLQKVLHGIG